MNGHILLRSGSSTSVIHNLLVELKGNVKAIVIFILVITVLNPTTGRGESTKTFDLGPETHIFIEGIQDMVKSFEVSDEVAKDFINMVIDWRNQEEQSLLYSLRNQIADTKKDFIQGRIHRQQVAITEEDAVLQLSQRIQKEIDYSESVFDIPKVLRTRKANCLAYSVIFFSLGNSIGLSVEGVDVTRLARGATLPPEGGHVACLVRLENRETIMVDLVPGGFVSKPFTFDEKFGRTGNYFKLKSKDDSLNIHGRIRVLTKNALLGSLNSARGVEHNKLGETTKALTDFQKAIELDPNSAAAYNNRGITYVMNGLFPEALRNFTTAIKLDPDYPQAYNNRGGAYAKSGHLADSLLDFNKAIELDAQYASPYCGRGNTYRMLHEYAKSISDLNESIRLRPDMAEAYFNRGLTYDDVGQSMRALSDYTKVIQLDSDYFMAYTNRGVIFSNMGQLKEARADYDKAISIKPDSAQAYFNRANISREMKELTEALNYYTKAIEIDEKFAIAYLNRGGTYYMLDRCNEAISDYTKLIELNPKLADAYTSRAAAFGKLGKLEKAKQDLLRAVNIDPAVKPLVKRIALYYKLDLQLND